jgi:hypothetical protein
VTGGCITKERIVVKMTDTTKCSWKGLIMAGMKPKNIIRKYSKESLEKLSSNGRKKLRTTCILRK